MRKYKMPDFEYKECLLETTSDLLPHTYYIDDNGKIVAFKRAGQEEIKVFSKPLSFSKRYRKFKKLN